MDGHIGLSESVCLGILVVSCHVLVLYGRYRSHCPGALKGQSFSYHDSVGTFIMRLYEGWPRKFDNLPR